MKKKTSQLSGVEELRLDHQNLVIRKTLPSGQTIAMDIPMKEGPAFALGAITLVAESQSQQLKIDVREKKRFFQCAIILN